MCKVHKKQYMFLFVIYNAKTVYALILQIVHFFTIDKMV